MSITGTPSTKAGDERHVPAGLDLLRIEERRQRLWRERRPYDVPPLADEHDGAPRTYIKASAIFPSGPLHLGHVRHLVLADVFARHRRRLGDRVLLTLAFDSFGETAVQAAERQGLAPAEWVGDCTGLMRAQAERLGISIDTERSFSSSEPEAYQWSQWLYVRLCEAGLLEPGAQRLDLTSYLAETRSNLKNSAASWSKLALGADKALSHMEKADVSVWSEGATWGAPVPLIHCEGCGPVLVPLADLPVLAPHDVDDADDHWPEATCPSCAAPATRDEHVLSARFDSLWLPLLPCVPAEMRSLPVDDALVAPETREWMPASHLIAGSDSGHFVLNQRLIAKALRDIGPLAFLADGEPFSHVTFHEMVLNGDDKMSKHLDNGVSPDFLIDEYGADALRLAIVLGATPAKPLRWGSDSPHALAKPACSFLRSVLELAEALADAPLRQEGWGSDEGELQAAIAHLEDQVVSHSAPADLRQALRAIMDFFIDELQTRFDGWDPGGIGTPPPAELREGLLRLLPLLAPFAPHICEDILEGGL
jgi:leucyl-tRNA synthetase